VTAAMHIGYDALKVRELHAHALRHAPCCKHSLPSRPPASQTRCFWLTACFARRLGAAPEIPRPASPSSARLSIDVLKSTMVGIVGRLRTKMREAAWRASWRA
jgi:hypothetical protein